MKKKLLLHSCCGPCSSGVLEDLSLNYDITVLFYNPNIYPEEEYFLRRDEQVKLIEKLKPQINIGFIELDYNPNEYYEYVLGLEDEPEGGNRCKKCYELRLDLCGRIASENGFDLFTTTLSVSPYKNANYLNELGEKISQKYGVDYLISDFKKKDGYLKSIQNSKKYGLYRQKYCGCKFSKR